MIHFWNIYQLILAGNWMIWHLICELINLLFRLARLQVVEMRENHLKALPKSMSRLVELRRLDIGNNDFFEFPEVVGTLSKLNEFWCDNNRINSIPSVCSFY